MIRQLLCPPCAVESAKAYADTTDGFMMTQIVIDRIKKPKSLAVELETDGMIQVFPVDVMVCDRCNCDMPEGGPGACVTIYQSGEQPESWEGEYIQQ